MNISRKFIMVITGVAGAIVALLAANNNRDNRFFEISKNLEIYQSVIRELDMYYVDSINPGELIEGSMNSMLEKLDPYTNYIPESEMADFKFMTTGEYGGIGALIGQRDNMVVVTDPYEGMPAQLSGVKAGDVILSINGVQCEGKKVSEVSDMLKGPSGTVIKIELKRPGQKKTENIAITRANITINPVAYSGMIDQNTGYIRLTSFTDKSSHEVQKALEGLKADGAKSIVLDLRSNPGGILDDAVEITNLFVPKGKTIVFTKGKLKQWDQVYKSNRQPIDTVIPLAVLVNGNSASASEIVSGSLQDLDRAVIIGARTYGKGLVQTTRPLSYNAKLKLTTSKYYIPSGRCIQAIDYSHKNADGSVARVPDSLTHVFYTVNGRKVKDGGGIMPDIDVEAEKFDQISYELIRQYMIFDFATNYALTHKSIANVKDFKLTDDDYKQFVAFLKEKKFEYKLKSAGELENLKKTLSEDGLSDKTKDLIAELQKKTEVDIESVMAHSQDEINQLLRQEIVKRYYYQKGEIQEMLKDDSGVRKAIEVLQNPTEYRATLGKQSKVLARN